MSLVNGSTIDFQTELIGSSFHVVDNPQASTMSQSYAALCPGPVAVVGRNMLIFALGDIEWVWMRPEL